MLFCIMKEEQGNALSSGALPWKFATAPDARFYVAGCHCPIVSLGAGVG